MFITIGGLSQHVSDFAGNMLLSNPEASESTAREAAQCVDRYVCGGDPRMHEANREFKERYGKPIIKNPATAAFGGAE